MIRIKHDLKNLKPIWVWVGSGQNTRLTSLVIWHSAGFSELKNITRISFFFFWNNKSDIYFENYPPSLSLWSYIFFPRYSNFFMWFLNHDNREINCCRLDHIWFRFHIFQSQTSFVKDHSFILGVRQKFRRQPQKRKTFYGLCYIVAGNMSYAFSFFSPNLSSSVLLYFICFCSNILHI